MVESWKKNYEVVPQLLDRMSEIQGVASVFNANIDAIVQADDVRFRDWMTELNEPLDPHGELRREIQSPEDVLLGFINGFRHGIAQEWLVTSLETYSWLQSVIGYDKLQMGGQGGIIANVMAICDVGKVYVHTASHEAQQASLFLNRENLLASDGSGQLLKAHDQNRAGDAPLIHWILEFKKGQVLELGGERIVCPKSNRFIATYDPLNFDLHVDETFAQKMKDPAQPLDVVLMSGFHMLSETLEDGSSGLERLESVWADVKEWKATHPEAVVHLEFASTQNVVIRKAIAEIVAPEVDSIGLNEQELIDILEILDRKECVARCREEMNSAALFEGTLNVYRHFKPYRCQLHMFGLYLTITSEKDPDRLKAIRNGMALAATLATTKAGTGSLENEGELLWGHGKEIWGPSIEEMEGLSFYLQQNYGVSDDFAEHGIVALPDFSIVALPTILVEKPISLVGMGDTISSLSLVSSLIK